MTKRKYPTPHSACKKIGKNVSWQEYAEHCAEHDKLPKKKKLRTRITGG